MALFGEAAPGEYILDGLIYVMQGEVNEGGRLFT